MTHTRLWIVATIIASIIVASFALSVPRARDGALPPMAPIKEEVIPTVSVHDVYRKGVHTITGSLIAPNACASAQTEVSLTDKEILIHITMSEIEGVCLQEETIVRFSTTIASPDRLPIRATVNGKDATTTEL